MNNYIVTFEYRVMVTAFAILAMLESQYYLFRPTKTNQPANILMQFVSPQYLPFESLTANCHTEARHFYLQCIEVSEGNCDVLDFFNCFFRFCSEQAANSLILGFSCTSRNGKLNIVNLLCMKFSWGVGRKKSATDNFQMKAPQHFS